MVYGMGGRGRPPQYRTPTDRTANNGRKKKLDEILDAPAADDDSYRISISA